MGQIIRLDSSARPTEPDDVVTSWIVKDEHDPDAYGRLLQLLFTPRTPVERDEAA
ncbi:hypothetical protein AB0H73_06445 [Streptomyces olivoreticuli]